MFSTKNHSVQNQNNYKLDAVTHGELGLNSTLFLAYRDIPELLKKNLFSTSSKTQYRLLDFGCGAGLSTEIFSKIFKNSGHAVEIHGVDICEENLVLARKRIPAGQFHKIEPGKSIDWLGTFDIIVCNFVLLEHPYKEMLTILNKIQPILDDSGVLIVTNCTSKAYKRSNRWYSFNSDFQENDCTVIKNGKPKIEEDHPVKVQVSSYDSGASFCFFDFYHSGRAYRNAYESNGFKLQETHKPMGKQTDGLKWKDEVSFSPYKIHVLKKETITLKQDLVHIHSRL
jgi:ubiquinone/menaquinone biosynthesis C-methylase UbiE